MTLLRSISFLLLSLAMLNVANAAPLTSATLKTLLEVSGTESRITSDTKGLYDLLEPQKSKADKGSKAEKALSRLLDPNTLSNGVTQALKKDVTEEQAKSVINWFKSPLGNKILKSEQNGKKAETIAEIRKLGPELFKDEERVKLATKLMLATQELTTSTIVQSSMLSASVAIYESINSPDKELKADKLIQNINGRMQDQVNTSIRQMQMITLYSFKDHSIADIDAYLEALRKPEMQAFKSAIASGIAAEIESAIEPLISK